MFKSTALLLVLSLMSEHSSGFAPIVPSSHLTPSSSTFSSASSKSTHVLLHQFKTKVNDQEQQTTQKTTQQKKSPFAFDVPWNNNGESNPELELDTTNNDNTLATPNNDEGGFSYSQFAKTYPNINNISIATIKTASADLLAQILLSHTPLNGIDWDRTVLFGTFGALYSGAFQYWYQVNIFKKMFDGVDEFTSLPFEDKIKDTDGLKTLAAQTAVDLTVLTLVYLPTFYSFKAAIFSGSKDPSVWVSTGLDNYITNFAKDELDLLRVWVPADLVCFSVPLYLRLPVRHVVSFAWTAYLSFTRGGH